jgi:aryl-alcohol dehydrogenase-like predicted oxidoreductase
MQTVKLGATRLEVTPIAYGTWQFRAVSGWTATAWSARA